MVQTSIHPRDLFLLGYDTLNEQYNELVKCYVTQVAIDEEIKFTVSRKPFQSDEALVFFEKGKQVTTGITLEDMAKYIKKQNPVFWDSLVSDDESLKLLAM